MRKPSLEKSFASHPKAIFWNYELNNGIKPEEVFLNSHKKYWFTCEECKHKFEIRLSDVNNNKWCPFCSNQKLCKNNKCKSCFNKSFAIAICEINYYVKVTY